MKIRILGVEHSTKVQQALFDLGYSWRGVDKTISHSPFEHIYADPTTLKMSFGFNDSLFKNDSRPEYVLDESNHLISVAVEYQNKCSCSKSKPSLKRVAVLAFLTVLTVVVVGAAGYLLAYHGFKI